MMRKRLRFPIYLSVVVVVVQNPQRPKLFSGKVEPPPHNVYWLRSRLESHTFFKMVMAKSPHVVSRLMMWEYEDRIISIRRSEAFIHTFGSVMVDTEEWKTISERMFAVLKNLEDVFSSGYYIGLLSRPSIVLLLYWLWRELTENYIVTKELKAQFSLWFNNFCRDASRSWSRLATSGRIFRERYRKLIDAFFISFPLVVAKAERRKFTEQERQILWKRDEGHCQWQDRQGQKCDAPLSYDCWHADHIKPSSEGGATDIKNGRVLCPFRNQGGKGKCPYKQDT